MHYIYGTRRAVRIYTFIPSNIKALFRKARKCLTIQNNSQMKTTPSKYKPLMLVTKDDEKVIIVAGNTQVTPNEFESEEDAEEYLTKQPYEMVINLISILMYYYEQDNKKNME